MSYKIAFPDFTDAEMPPIPAGWFDASWKNDACPSFTCGEYTIWIDYEDQNRREWPGPNRFQITRIDHTENPFTVFESDDFDSVVAFVQERTK